jgi:carboxyl-terminal processing protease
MASSRRWLLFSIPVVLAGLAAGAYGTRAQGQTAPGTPNASEYGTTLSSFSKFYSLIEKNAATPLDPDKAIYSGAIPGMLRSLDPHSTFFDPKEYRALREDQKGRYFGVGMQVMQRKGETLVQAPFPGSPAYRAGLRPGDVIAAVNGRSTASLSTSEVADLLRGPRGTQVSIEVHRVGAPQPLMFSVTRDEITRKSVQNAFWLKPGVAYVKIDSFTETTSRELEDNFRTLGESSMKGLVLDLRDNPGGLLNEGVAVAGHFLPRGSLVVSHRGRASAERPYTARVGNHGLSYPIVVLVNGQSASAAEIVSGALQDHDRAWILGENTFGKGLVQTVFPMAESTGLALTTAHFYTPSGRLIQRDYSNRSFYDYYFHNDAGARNPADVKMTDGGRTVYGGGGITPDETYKEPPLNRLQAALYRDALFNFARVYFARHGVSLSKGWMPDAATLAELQTYLREQHVEFTEAGISAQRDWIRRHLARELYLTAFGMDESSRVFAEHDPEVEQAVASMAKAAALVESARKVIVQRLAPNPAAGAVTAR